ncbi:hypothetical protein [Micavibrio aeruginosavorus]|uniref:hypothetical protein n=1 Tax=Micavibrio aeruginosavorus TaxID=349221 RepID=UPI003F4AE635
MTEQNNKPDVDKIEHAQQPNGFKERLKSFGQAFKQHGASGLNKAPGVLKKSGLLFGSGLLKTGKVMGTAALVGTFLAAKKLGVKRGLALFVGLPLLAGAAIAFGGIAIPAAVAIGGFLGIKKLNQYVPLQKILGWTALSPIIIAAGQLLFQERVNPINYPKDSFDYMVSQSGANYKTMGSYIMTGGMWAVDKVNQGIDASTVPGTKLHDIAADHGVVEKPKTPTAMLNIPDNHMAIECYPKMTQDFKKANGKEITSLKKFSHARLEQWKKDPNGLLMQYAAKGDVMIIYPKFNDKAQTLAAPKSFEAGSYAACPTGYERDLHQLKAWMQNKHTAR